MADTSSPSAEMTSTACPLLRMVILGEPKVGKTAVFRCLSNYGKASPVKNRAKDKRGNNGETMAHVTHMRTTKIGDHDAVTSDLYIFDPIANELDPRIAFNYCKESHFAVLVYDVTNPDSYSYMNTWLNRLYQDRNCTKAEQLPRVFIVGNKCDVSKRQRKVNYSDGAELQTKLNAMFWTEVSAKKGKNIDLLIDAIQRTIESGDYNPNPRGSSGCGFSATRRRSITSLNQYSTDATQKDDHSKNDHPQKETVSTKTSSGPTTVHSEDNPTATSVEDNETKIEASPPIRENQAEETSSPNAGVDTENVTFKECSLDESSDDLLSEEFQLMPASFNVEPEDAAADRDPELSKTLDDDAKTAENKAVSMKSESAKQCQRETPLAEKLVNTKLDKVKATNEEKKESPTKRGVKTECDGESTEKPIDPKLDDMQAKTEEKGKEALTKTECDGEASSMGKPLDSELDKVQTTIEIEKETLRKNECGKAECEEQAPPIEKPLDIEPDEVQAAIEEEKEASIKNEGVKAGGEEELTFTKKLLDPEKLLTDDGKGAAEATSKSQTVSQQSGDRPSKSSLKIEEKTAQVVRVTCEGCGMQYEHAAEVGSDVEPTKKCPACSTRTRRESLEEATKQTVAPEDLKGKKKKKHLSLRSSTSIGSRLKGSISKRLGPHASDQRTQDSKHSSTSQSQLFKESEH